MVGVFSLPINQSYKAAQSAPLSKPDTVVQPPKSLVPLSIEDLLSERSYGAVESAAEQARLLSVPNPSNVTNGKKTAIEPLNEMVVTGDLDVQRRAALALMMGFEYKDAPHSGLFKKLEDRISSPNFFARDTDLFNILTSLLASENKKANSAPSPAFVKAFFEAKDIDPLSIIKNFALAQVDEKKPFTGSLEDYINWGQRFTKQVGIQHAEFSFVSPRMANGLYENFQKSFESENFTDTPFYKKYWEKAGTAYHSALAEIKKGDGADAANKQQRIYAIQLFLGDIIYDTKVDQSFKKTLINPSWWDAIRTKDSDAKKVLNDAFAKMFVKNQDAEEAMNGIRDYSMDKTLEAPWYKPLTTFDDTAMDQFVSGLTGTENMTILQAYQHKNGNVDPIKKSSDNELKDCKIKVEELLSLVTDKTYFATNQARLKRNIIEALKPENKGKDMGIIMNNMAVIEVSEQKDGTPPDPAPKLSSPPSTPVQARH